MSRILALILLLFVLLFSNCAHDFPEDDFSLTNQVVFNLINEEGTLKSGVNCAWEVDYAMVIISYGKDRNRKTNTYFLSSYIENGVLYTEPLTLNKLRRGEYYKLDEMLLYADDDLSQDNPIGDRLISAAPHDGSKFGMRARRPLSVQFEVDAFNTTEVDLSVFCFEGANPEDFGFVWFQPSVTVVKQKWFFGDFCTSSFNDYTGSLYDLGGDLTVDMSAIYLIELYCDNNNDGIFYDDELIGNFSNEEEYPSGIVAPVSVIYPDDSYNENHFEIRLFVYMKVINGFGYVNVGNLYFEDDNETLYKTPIISRNLQNDEAIVHGSDNIYDFIIGNCNIEFADFSFDI